MKSYLLLAFISILFISCSGSKEVVSIPFQERKDIEIRSAVNNHNVDYDWWAAKANATIMMPEETLKGTMYMRAKKDSMIWLVFKKFNAEAIRLKMTQDSFHVIYRLQRKYDEGSMNELKRVFNIDLSFNELQDFFVGNIIDPKSTEGLIVRKENSYILNKEWNNKTFKHWLGGGDLLIYKSQYIDENGRDLTTQLSNYKSTDDIMRIPYLRTYKVPLENESRAEIKLDFKEISFEKPKRTIFRIPESYIRVN